jgi:SNF2 family DNA or RNA helicase
MAELEKFAPSLRAIRFDGSERKQLQSRLTEAQVIVTSFSLLQRDAEFWHTVPLHSLIIDEAQYVKNSKAKTAQVIRELNCEHRLCLTGTPMENHLGELWSLFDFVIPGFCCF